VFRKSKAYFVSDIVLLQTKKTTTSFPPYETKEEREREKERGDTDTKGTEKSNEKEGSDSISCFLSSIYIRFFFFLCFRLLHLVKLVFLFLKSSFPLFMTPQFSFFIQDLRWVHVISLNLVLCICFCIFVFFFLNLRTLSKIRSNS